MTISYTGKFGELRILDSGSAYQSGNVQTLYDDSAATYTDVSTATNTDDTTYTGAILDDTADYLYLALTERFCRAKVILNAAAVGSGALIAQYYNGSSWAALDATELSDGTASGGDCFAQAGSITWKIPADWAAGGNASVDGTGALYLIRFAVTSAPGTPPDFDVIRPERSLYYVMPFEQMDFRGVEGVGRPDEILVLDRGLLTTAAHYVQGLDDKTMEPLDVSWSVRLNTELTGGQLSLLQALTCGNPNTTYWGATGTSTKTDTRRVDGSGNLVYTPPFADGATSLKKTVCVQALWRPAGSATGIMGREWNEVFFELSAQEIQEAEDSVMATLNGKCYGAIRDIFDFGYQH